MHVDTRQHDSRWYPGAGIYRKVQLIAVDPVHTDIWGVQITTPVVKPNYADVNVIAKVVNQSVTLFDEITVSYTILSPAGKELTTKEVKAKRNIERLHLQINT